MNTVADAVRTARAAIEMVGPDVAKLDDLQGLIAAARKELEETRQRCVDAQTEFTKHPVHSAQKNHEAVLAALVKTNAELTQARLDLMNEQIALAAVRRDHDQVSASMEAIKRKLG